MIIIAITSEYREEVNTILKNEWACPPIVSRGRVLDATSFPGFIFLNNNKISGLVTYNIEFNECEIVTLDSFEENMGIGTALINSVLAAAKEKFCNRIWLITTNDNTKAIRFYQRRGFDLVAIHINAIEQARKIKPSIPLFGIDNIPIKHEVEFEVRL